MAFFEGRISDCVRYGYSGGSEFNTAIVTVNSGAEQRNALWANGRGSWDIEYVEDVQGFRELRNFFEARRGMSQGFRFKDWLDYTDEGIGTFIATSNPAVWQMVKKYSPTSTPYKIYKPTTKVVIKKDGAVFTGASVDTTTGLVTITDGTVIDGSSVFVWEGEFDKPVRFDTDKFSASVTDKNIYSIGSLPIVEIKDYL